MSEVPDATPRTVTRASLGVLLGVGFYAFYAMSVPGMAAPYFAREFTIGDAGITFLSAVMSIGAFGAVALTRMADRRGRRLVVLAATGLLPLASLVTAVAPAAAVYAVAQLLALSLHGTLNAVLPVMIAEQSAEARRARGQAWYALIGSLGGGLALVLLSAVEGSAWGWRWAFAVGVLPLLALPWLRSRLPETGRFERAEARGAVARARMADLLADAHRSRTLAMLGAAGLRNVAMIAIGSWAYYHAVRSLGLDPWTVTLIYVSGGSLGMIGIPLGVWCSDHWGRRPTWLLATAITVAGGVAYFWVPGDGALGSAVALGACFGLFNLGTQAQGVADRCLNTELFPTALRATYAGWLNLVIAAAGVTTQLALSGLSLALGSLALAVSVVALGALLPALWIFARRVPETRGLSLDEAALEEL